ncbi:general transcription factor II-I repeat domain-containing protein 2-like [Octopus sinensis]|uniref:General transcription factor II-I repeat domain-containing protein 2-like n=1 Tax=Octopus sinensis TaxID=2607531 RepID=A0A6P7TUR5_9MOLL|nr:general transcription factor II-I repeat domain-containing protein 2-like [Octopus sinensis]
MAVAENLFPTKRNIFESICLSPRTVTRKVEEMSFDLNNSLKNIFGNFKYFSIALDTSTDRRDTSQLVIFVRGITETYQIFEEFVKVIPIMGTVTGTDVFLHLMQLLIELNLPLSKLVGITTDGAPSMVGNKKGTITLLQNEMEKFGIEHNLVKIHCIVHQEALVAKSVRLRETMDAVVNAVNFILSRGLNHRQFRQFLIDTEAEYGDLLYFCNVRWLSRGSMLKRFFHIREDVIIFLEEKNYDASYFRNTDNISKLAFFVDITSHLNDLNLKLQGSNKFIHQMYAEITAFENKLKLWELQLQKGNMTHFVNFLSTNPTDVPEYANIVMELRSEFSSRFMDLRVKCAYIIF